MFNSTYWSCLIIKESLARCYITIIYKFHCWSICISFIENNFLIVLIFSNTDVCIWSRLAILTVDEERSFTGNYNRINCHIYYLFNIYFVFEQYIYCDSYCLAWFSLKSYFVQFIEKIILKNRNAKNIWKVKVGKY